MIAAPTMSPPTAPDAPTGQICEWVASLNYDDIPDSVKERAKYILLDGIACALVGAHLPWCEKAVKAISKMEMPGVCSIAGWEGKNFGPLPAALLNSTFIQAFELDDYHSEAPLHSESIVFPAIFAAAQHLKNTTNGEQIISGAEFLLAAIVGFEVGPRIGQALYGAEPLKRGWHTGPVFGHATSAAAVSKLLGFTAATTEDAIGTACTQACGLMSAQFESDTKRMQHGFAARNGLFAALLSAEEFVGIKQVLERPYGGFLSQFSQGNGMEPPYKVDELTKNLGSFWETERINIKPYASMGGTHPTIDCIRGLQSKYPETFSPENLNIDDIMAIEISLQAAPFEHGGWQAAQPLSAIGAQMNNAYCAATQLVDGDVSIEQFASRNLGREKVWALIEKTTCRQADEFPHWKRQRVTIQMADGKVLEQQVEGPRGVEPRLTNEEVLAKARDIVKTVISKEKWAAIEEFVLNMDNHSDVGKLGGLMAVTTVNPIA